MTTKSFLIGAIDDAEIDEVFLDTVRYDINDNLADTHDTIEEFAKSLDDNNDDDVYRVVKITIEVVGKVTRNGKEN